MKGRIEVDVIGWRVTLAIGSKGVLVDTSLLSEVDKPDPDRPNLEGAPQGQFEHGYGFGRPRWSPYSEEDQPDP